MPVSTVPLEWIEGLKEGIVKEIASLGNDMEKLVKVNEAKEEIQRKLLQQVFLTMGPIGSETKKALVEAIQEAFSGIPGLQEFFKAAREEVPGQPPTQERERVIKDIAKDASNILKFWKAAGMGLMVGLKTTMTHIWEGAAGKIKDYFGELKGWFRNALSEILGEAEEYFDLIKGFFGTVWTVGKTVMTGAWKGVTQGWSAAKEVFEGEKSPEEETVERLEDLTDETKKQTGILKKIWEYFKEQAASSWISRARGLMTGATGAGAAGQGGGILSSILGGLGAGLGLGGVGGILKGGLGALKAGGAFLLRRLFWPLAVIGIAAAIYKYRKEIKEGLLYIGSYIKDWLIDIGGKAAEWLGEKWDDVKDKYGEVKDAVINKLSEWKDNFVNLLSDAWKWIKETFSWENIKKAMSGAWDWAKDTAWGVAGAVGRGAIQAYNYVSDIAAKGLGALSAKFESGNKGSAAIGYDTRGGASYGKYQIATQTGTMSNFMNFIKSKYPDIYARLGPLAGTAGYTRGAFADEWKKLAGEGRLGSAEHEFIKASHFDPEYAKLDPQLQAMVKSSKVLQDVLWSRAVQTGEFASSDFNKAFKDVGGNKEELIKRIYALSSKHFNRAKLGESVWGSVQRRLGTDELGLALAALSSDRDPSKTETLLSTVSPGIGELEKAIDLETKTGIEPYSFQTEMKRRQEATHRSLMDAIQQHTAAVRELNVPQLSRPLTTSPGGSEPPDDIAALPYLLIKSNLEVT